MNNSQRLIIFYVFFYFCTLCSCLGANRSFTIDYEHNTFLKDGQKFRYVSGSIHYFRIVEEYWDRTLKTIKLGGFNAVTTYVEWQSHQPTPSENYNFEGNLNLFKFLDTAKNNDLLVILRPGPYIDAERDMGGFPPWLLWQKSEMKLRSSDAEYIYFVAKWFDHLLPRLRPYLYENGGPIITIQVENEYGAYGCDKNYTSFLRDLIRSHLGNNIVLFTTDNANNNYVSCGSIPTVYPTVDFGPEWDISVYIAFAVQRYHAWKGPLVNSEYYPGWLDHWQKPHSKVSSAKVVSTLHEILSLGANVNLYMIYGGTSFGFGAGATGGGNSYDACPTSYDYDAPINEAGDPTEKFFTIKKTISKSQVSLLRTDNIPLPQVLMQFAYVSVHLPQVEYNILTILEYLPVPSEDPVVQPKAAYGKIMLKPFSHILHSEFLSLFGESPIISEHPLSFEELKVGSGFVIYVTNITFIPTDPALLSLPDLKDRAYVFVNEIFAGVLSRSERILSMPLLIRNGSRLEILVENQGRVCTGPAIGESKGIGAKVILGDTLLKNWTMYRLGKLNGRRLSKYSRTATVSISDTNSISEENNFDPDFARKLMMSRGGGSLLVGNFTVDTKNGKLLDTFIDFEGFSKGFVWINGFNLGRYWPVVGPQKTLYLPAPLLKAAPAQNTMVLIELEWTPESCYFDNYSDCFVTLTDKHIIDGPTPYTK